MPDLQGTNSLAAAIPLRRHDNQPERRKVRRFIHHSTKDHAPSTIHDSQGSALLLALILPL